MNFAEGVKHMANLVEALKLTNKEKDSFQVGSLLITYPGYKKRGDYRLSENGIAPTHTDIVQTIYDFTSTENFQQVSDFLDDVYKNGLHASSTTFPPAFKEKIYWITLQEDINYPPPAAGRKLAFQRFYEGALAKMGVIRLEQVFKRTNNHGKAKPVLFDTANFAYPSFYV